MANAKWEFRVKANIWVKVKKSSTISILTTLFQYIMEDSNLKGIKLTNIKVCRKERNGLPGTKFLRYAKICPWRRVAQL